jgi:hypothetical protein
MMFARFWAGQDRICITRVQVVGVSDSELRVDNKRHVTGTSSLLLVDRN